MLASASSALGHCTRTAHADGPDTGVLRAAKALADRAVAEGHGEQDLARMASVHRARGGETGEEAPEIAAG